MSEVKIYTIPGCPFCARAKELLKSKNIRFKEIDASSDAVWNEMEKLAKRDTVPQIFIDGRHIGGCDDLLELEKKGKLDKLLN